VERFVDFHLHVANLIMYHVPSHHTPIWVPHYLQCMHKFARGTNDVIIA